MLTSAFRPLLAAALMVAFSAPALAAAGPQSFDQYPSFFELTSTTANGATAVLRCGYFSPSGRMVELDKGFHEISIINKAQKYYSRIQHIDNAIIATTSDPTGGAGLLLELVKPDGSTVAKNCQTDVNTDTIGNCRALKPFTFADQVKMGDEKIAQQCEDLMRSNGAQLNPALANPQKVEAFKNALREKANLLAAP